MASKFFKKPKNIALQLLNLNLKYSGISSEIKNNHLIWTQEVKPSSLSKKYILTLDYDGGIPRVYLYNQGIVNDKDEEIPHCYKQNYISEGNEYVQICIYYPKYKEWTRDMFLSETIIPWAVDWIYYYEQWRITGKWLGGGIIHEKSKKNSLPDY